MAAFAQACLRLRSSSSMCFRSYLARKGVVHLCVRPRLQSALSHGRVSEGVEAKGQGLGLA